MRQRFKASKGKTLKERFEEKFIKGNPDECWEWNGDIQEGRKWGIGYGRIHCNGESGYSHRVSYLLYRGDPGKFHVCHKCDNSLCVNPDHLFLGTHQDNMKDRNAKWRHRHKLSPVDLIIIQDAISMGYRTLEIAQYFKVHQTTIISIKNKMLCATS